MTSLVLHIMSWLMSVKCELSFIISDSIYLMFYLQEKCFQPGWFLSFLIEGGDFFAVFPW